MQDPLVEEVRRAGEQYLARFNFDLKRVFEDLRRRSEQAGRKTVALPPRLITSKPAEHKKVG